jgi:hypothetical protein
MTKSACWLSVCIGRHPIFWKASTNACSAADETYAWEGEAIAFTWENGFHMADLINAAMLHQARILLNLRDGRWTMAVAP